MDDVRPDSPETIELLKQARMGDRQALEQLFGGYRPYLRRFVELRLDPKLRARVDSSDILQEAQLEAVRRLNDYLERPPMPFRLRLRQITSDRLLKMRRHHVATARRSVEREMPLPEQSSMVLAQQLLGV